MNTFHRLTLIAISLTLLGCEKKPVDLTPPSWIKFVDASKAGETEFFKELAEGLGDAEMSYQWHSSHYSPRSQTGEIQVIIIRPDDETYKVGFVFKQNNGKWEKTVALDYREKNNPAE
ncbi:hypothetical protein [Rubinisphaera sp.]|uniref:hypothetical protein n=1 Tax=Rubinisphaera sp. TaxID=2024857 RepID=UPI000C11FCDF|nr:hypothetical protein [Rubinisphaera sp.]MBV09573.1 hypothetical protein [Rubinisphaera sp.]HCS50796.1 hypothetical protein [Planctomycetaceae bacterium]|tara:strand:+ start:277 stop:630 length:354 start_codon:yes stop_codon:yes gene_type:complete